MRDPEKKTLRQVLEDIATLPWDHALYLPKGDPWSLETRGMVLDPDDAADEGDTPPAAKAAGLEYALDVQSVRGVVDNLRGQRPTANAAALLDALLYYYDHDAFLQLE